MARAARRSNMAHYDSDSDDEPVGGHYRSNRAQRGNAAAAASAAAAPAAARPAVAASATSSVVRQEKPARRLLDPTPPPSPPRNTNANSKAAGSRRIVAPPSPDSIGDEDDDDGGGRGGGGGGSNGHSNCGGGSDGGPGWGWVTAKLFVQEERTLELWGDLVDSDLIPSPRDADLEDVRAFKALCAKNPKWIRGGIAFEQRPDVWELLSGSRVYGGRLENPINYYKSLVKQSANMPSKQKKDIRADITRTMQEHPKFKTKPAQAELDRILSAYCVRNPTVGYCQSMSHVVGFLMLFYNEESCFWFLCTLIDSYLPSEFYAPSLLGVRVDTEVLGRLLAEKQKKLAVHFAKYDIDIRLVALKWFMCLFLLSLPLETAARVWDVFLLEGSSVLFSFALALLDTHKALLLSLQDTSQILEALQRLGSDLSGPDVDLLVKKAFSSVGTKEKEVAKLRALVRPQLEKEYVAQLQTMESRRENEERARRRAEAARVKLERAEESALELGTEVTKVPHNAFGLASFFSEHSRPRRVRLRLFHTRAPKPRDGENGGDASAAAGEGGAGRDEDGHAGHRSHVAAAAGSGGADQLKRGGGGQPGDSGSGGNGAPGVPGDDWRIVWEGSQRKSEAQRSIHLNECQLVIGTTHGVFGARPKVGAFFSKGADGAPQDHLCASFLVPANAAIGRDSTSLDVVFDTPEQVQQWLKVLRRSNILKVQSTASGGAADGKKGGKAKDGEKVNGASSAPPPGAAASSAAAAPVAAALPAAAASSSAGPAAGAPSGGRAPAPPAGASSFDDSDSEGGGGGGGGGGGRRRRHGKSLKGGGGGALSSWEEVSDDADADAPQPRPAARKLMAKAKEDEEADQFDVRDF